MVWTQAISSLVALMPDWIWVSELATIWMSSMAMNWPMIMPPKPRNTRVQFTGAPSAPSATGTSRRGWGGPPGLMTVSVTGSAGDAAAGVASLDLGLAGFGEA